MRLVDIAIYFIYTRTVIQIFGVILTIFQRFYSRGIIRCLSILVDFGKYLNGSYLFNVYRLLLHCPFPKIRFEQCQIGTRREMSPRKMASHRSSDLQSNKKVYYHKTGKWSKNSQIKILEDFNTQTNNVFEATKSEITIFDKETLKWVFLVTIISNSTREMHQPLVWSFQNVERLGHYFSYYH